MRGRVLAAVVAGWAGAAAARSGEGVTVAAWLATTWDYEASYASFVAHAAVLDEISPIWYWVTADGRAVARRPNWATADDPGPCEAEIRRACRVHGIRLIPLISNSSARKGFDADLVGRIVRSEGLRGLHVRHLVDLAVDREYDGIEVDYESLHGADRDAYSTFLAELAGALHDRGKRLAVALQAKTDEAGSEWGSAAHDYAAIGRVVDSVRIMAYDHHWSTGPAGPVAPLPWFRQVLAFASSAIPCERLLMGVPTYGYDWTGRRTGKSVDVAARDAAAQARRKGAALEWDPVSNSPFFRYREGERAREVWYESAACLPQKLKAVREAGVAGIAIFRLGSEEESFWSPL